MEKIKCINAEGFSLITLNKVYEVVNSSRDYYYIKNDANIEKRYGRSRFELVTKPTKIEEVVKPVPKPKVEQPKPKGLICKFGKGTQLLYNKVYYPKGITDDNSHYIIEVNGKDEKFTVGRFIPEE
jgi:hypothetical protein